MSGFVMGFERGFGLRPVNQQRGIGTLIRFVHDFLFFVSLCASKRRFGVVTAQPEKLSNTPFSPPVVILLCIDPSCTWIEQWVHRAGPREKIYFGPEDVKAAIDTCGGICPGLNDVIRHIFITLEIYGVKNVVGITLENDILHMDKTFGFETAIEETQLAINSAYIEAHSAYHGIGAAKLMGRSSGFIAMIVPDASLASGPVDLCIIPEVPFNLHGPDGVLKHLNYLIGTKGSAVICVAEGAGQTFLENTNAKDASGNKLLGDIRCSHSTRGLLMTFYIDPTYMIQAVPANESDGILCTVLGQNAVHGAFSGYSGITVGIINNHYAYLPIPEVVAYDKSVDPNSRMWQCCLTSTGQPDFL
ncbi:hypothetical protein Bca52824_033474 [Brassica carinata]|uniref:Phosphofructokinase domain-containing protein n=1 Tax=Brassica carinata TaxID=52824 RepID=A0A8X7SCK7_BRACI|nr:hypothetical protein Bca52824_033474 [Brassica carinata]